MERLTPAEAIVASVALGCLVRLVGAPWAAAFGATIGAAWIMRKAL